MQNHSLDLEYARRAKSAELQLTDLATMVRQNIETLDRAVHALNIDIDPEQIPQLGESLTGDRCNRAERAVDDLLASIDEAHSLLSNYVEAAQSSLEPEPVTFDQVRTGQLLGQVRHDRGIGAETVAAGLGNEVGDGKGRPVGYVHGVEAGRYAISLPALADWVEMCGVTVAEYFALEKDGAPLTDHEKAVAAFIQPTRGEVA